MTPKLLQLYSLRAQVEALIALEEAEFASVPAAAGCPHPEDKRVSKQTMGGAEPTFLCRQCGETVKGVA